MTDLGADPTSEVSSFQRVIGKFTDIYDSN